jgi:hypothetical protein
MANNEFVVKNGLIVSGSTNVSGSIAATSFTGSFSGSIAAPGSDTFIIRNIGGALGATDDLFYDNVDSEARLTIGLGSGGADGVRFIGPMGPFIYADGPTSIFRFGNGQDGLEIDGGTNSLILRANNKTILLGNGSTGTASFPGGVNVTGSLNVSGSGKFSEHVILSGSLEFQGTTNNLYFAPSTDVRNWYLTGKNFSVTDQDATPNGIYFKDDGTRFYIIGASGDRIYQYDLSTAWDASTAVYNSVNLSVAIRDTVPTDLFISPDGSILFMLGDTNNAVYRYDLTTPWDISAVTFINSFSVTAEEATPNGLYFDPTGTNMYVVGTTGDDVNQYTLGTAWDLTTAAFLQSASLLPFESSPTAISFNNSGSRMYILGTTGDDITEFRLTTPWDVSTATFFSTGFTFVTETVPGGLYYNETEEVAYVVGNTVDTVIGLKTSPQIKYYGDSFVTDGQMFIGGRFETANEAYINGTLNASSTITTGGSLVSSNSSFSTSNINLGTGTSTVNVNIGGNGAVSTNNRFAYGATAAGLTKTIQIGTGGLSGSITNLEIGAQLPSGSTLNTTIGSLPSSGRTALVQNTQFAQNAFINNTLNVSNNPYILDSAQSASGNIPVFDSFTEVSNTLLNLHTPDTGSGWSRVQIGAFTTPTMTVFGATNTAGPTSTVADQGVIYRQDTPLTSPDYEVSINLVTQDSSDDVLWLFARYQDGNNWYGVRWSTSQSTCILVRKLNGIFTTLATLLTAPVVGATTLSIRVQDGIIVVTNGGNVVMSAYDPYITSAGYAAIGGGNIGLTSTDDFDATWKFDNFQVRYYQPGIQTSNITGSLNISNIVTLTPQSPLPTGVPTGSFAVSSSVPTKPYFWDGSSWNSLY